MVSRLSLPPAVRAGLPIVLPAFAILLARAATFTDWAQGRPQLAALIFAWIVVDSLALGLLAKAPKHKPTLYQVMAVLAVSCLIVLAGASEPVRAIYVGMPEVLVAAGITVTLFLGWSALRFASDWRASGSLAMALESRFPPLLLRFARAESRMMRLALLSWGERADVPEGARAFAYHTYLTPMIATLLALQLIELSVMHFLLMLWNPAVAWVLLGLSLWGVLWTVALLKSFRLCPVLIEDSKVRARSGLMYDLAIPIGAIEAWNAPFTRDELDSKAVLNLAILSSPNVSLRFSRPLPLPTFFGGERQITGVALRLDDSAAFIARIEHLKPAPK